MCGLRGSPRTPSWRVAPAREAVLSDGRLCVEHLWFLGRKLKFRSVGERTCRGSARLCERLRFSGGLPRPERCSGFVREAT